MRSKLAVVAVALCGVFTMTGAMGSVALATKSGCMNCHIVDRKLVGPAFRDVAVKYKGRADAVTFLTQRVRQGGPGNWGPVPMAPNDVKQISDADLKKVLGWILDGAK